MKKKRDFHNAITFSLIERKNALNHELIMNVVIHLPNLKSEIWSRIDLVKCARIDPYSLWCAFESKDSSSMLLSNLNVEQWFVKYQQVGLQKS